ncbi:MAG: DUF1189 family protein [Patescibacteria group bacterium]
MNFLTKIKNSIYNPEFYSHLRGAGISSSFKYFINLCVVLSIILAFSLGIEFSSIFTKERLEKVIDFYPAELAIQIKGGVVSTNVSEPYIVKAITKNPSSKNLLVIDTKSDFSIDTFKSFDTPLLIGKNFAVTSKREGQFEFTDLSKIPDFSLDRAKLLHWSDKIVSHHWLISLGIFFSLLVSFLIFFFANLLWLLIVALIIFGLARLKKVAMTYKEAYQISLHAVTLTLLLTMLSILFVLPSPFTFSGSLVTIIIAFINLKNLRTSHPMDSAKKVEEEKKSNS